MASFVSSSVCPSITLPCITRAAVPSFRLKSFSINGVGQFSGLKHIPQVKELKAVSISHAIIRSGLFSTTISCSAQAETLETVQSTIAKQLSVDVSVISPNSKFAELGADSLDTVEIMMALEEQFGVSIGEGGAENIATVQDAADLVEKLKP